MSAAEAQAEPTMEEILASIRKIISEDDKPAEAPLAMAEPEDDFLELADPAPAEEHVSADFDFDALALDDPEPIAEPIVEDTFEEISFEPEPMPEPSVFENDEIIAVDIEQEPEPEPLFEAPAPAPEPISFERAYEPPPIFNEAPPAPVSTGSRMPPHLAESIGLIGANAANAASDAFARLGTSLPGHFANGVSVEELVAHLLKPMLKDWLDTNLPRIVEERVEAELARIARRGF